MIDGREQSRRGLFWLGSAAIVARVVDVTATLAVVGLLTREQMGLAALVLSACAVLEAVSGAGVGSALVQSSDVTKSEESSLFWWATLVGLALGTLLVGLGPVLGSAYGDARLAPLAAVSGLKLLFIGVSVVPLALLSKALRFKEVGAVQTLASLGEGATKIALALGGGGAWALVLGNVMRGVVLVVALWAIGEFRPQLRFALRETTRFLRFGLHVAGSSILFQVYKNVDYFLVGRFLGIESLGLYRVAFDVAMQPADAINAVVGRVGFPVYSRLSRDLGALRSAFLSNTRSLLSLVAPIAVLTFFGSEALLTLIGGGRWIAAVPAVQILVVAGFLRAATVGFGQIYVAVGRPQLATLESAVTLVISSALFCLGLYAFPELGVLSVCFAWPLGYPVFLACHLLVSRRLIELTPSSYLRVMASALAPVPVLAAGCYAVQRATEAASSSWLPLVSMALACLVIYGLYIKNVLKASWRDVVPKRSHTTPLPNPR